ncbi:MAG: 30S ribosome-binding factor RbfA [SAR324 cluster bacterium]|nr:30S ribosome-binding factor RbfA [SAR324 cluster bacterium]
MSAMVHKKLSEILFRKSKDPRFQRVTISRVEMDMDSTYAKIYIAMFPPEHVEDVVISLNKAAGFFSSHLGKTLHTRHTPKLVFVYDHGFDDSMQIDSILRENHLNDQGKSQENQEQE